MTTTRERRDEASPRLFFNPEAFLPPLFMLSAVAALLLRGPITIAAFGLSACLVLFSRRTEIHRAAREAGLPVWLAATVALLWLGGQAVFDVSKLYHIAVTGVAVLAAWSIARTPLTYVQSSAMALVVPQAILLGFLSSSIGNERPLEGFLPDASANVLTGVLLVLQINYSLARFLVSGKLTLITPVVTLLICFAGYGRSSILIAAAVVASLYGWQFLIWAFRNRLAATGVVALFAVAAATFGGHAIEAVSEGSKLRAGLYDPHRAAIVDAYSGQIDSTTIWTGAPYEGTAIENRFNGNPHIAYLRAHHIFGLPFVLAILGCVGFFFYRQRTLAGFALGGALLSLLLLRAATDTVLFPTPLDFVFYANCLWLGRSIQVRPE